MYIERILLHRADFYDANNKTKRRFLPNLQYHRFWVESEKRFVRLRTTAKGMRIIDKRGIDAVLAEIRARGEKV